MTVEKIVRPYLPPPGYTGLPVPPASPKAPTEAKVTLTGPTGTDFVETDISVTVTDWKVEKNKEDSTQRKTEQQRVENPDDPNQFVMVPRITETTFENKDTKQRKRFTFESMTGGKGATGGGGGKGSPTDPQGSKDKPVQLDPFQTIKEVGWGGGVFAVFKFYSFDYHFAQIGRAKFIPVSVKLAYELEWNEDIFGDGSSFSYNKMAVVKVSTLMGPTDIPVPGKKQPPFSTIISGCRVMHDVPPVPEDYFCGVGVNLEQTAFDSDLPPGNPYLKPGGVVTKDDVNFIAKPDDFNIAGETRDYGPWWLYREPDTEGNFVPYSSDVDHLWSREKGLDPDIIPKSYWQQISPPTDPPDPVNPNGIWNNRVPCGYVPPTSQLDYGEKIWIDLWLYPVANHEVYPSDRDKPIRKIVKTDPKTKVKTYGDPTILWHSQHQSKNATIPWWFAQNYYALGDSIHKIPMGYPLAGVSVKDSDWYVKGPPPPPSQGYIVVEFRKKADGRLIKGDDVAPGGAPHWGPIGTALGRPPPLDTMPPDNLPPSP